PTWSARTPPESRTPSTRSPRRPHRPSPSPSAWHRHPRPARCPAYNLLTDAEWEPLADGALARRLAYGCELQPGHPGMHAAQAQGEAPSRDTWLRWGDGTRELVELPNCRAVRRGPDPKGVDDEGCSLFADHAGAHAVGEWLEDLELEPEHRYTGR
ncbi:MULTISPECIES: hypothetical protein, partial [unclassified Nonomuraea]|uniref:hypothetical protein n=1 Tax=unclassified Nonomuraea TaxID=2593643 RepID=UPI0033C0EE3F